MLKSYTLSLQTLTPAALKLSRRNNMRLNDYRSIVEAMASEGVPVRTELMWPLPGDTIDDLLANLDELFSIFPDVQLYGFVLLPGTEFFERRYEYEIGTEHLSPYDGLRGDYVVSTLSCSRADAVRGYLAIAAQMVLTGTGVMPLTIRYLAMRGEMSASSVLLDVLEGLVKAYPEALSGAHANDDLAVFECRVALRLAALRDRERTFAIVRERIQDQVSAASNGSLKRILQVVALDEALSAPPGLWDARTIEFDFHAHDVHELLIRMELPDDELFAAGDDRLEVTYLPFGKLGVTVIPTWGRTIPKVSKASR
jgi:hypothetical protein